MIQPWPWMLAGVCLLPALLLALVGTGRGAADHRFAALQVATALTTWLLVALSFAFDQASSIDLALLLALLTLPGTFLFALFQERWL